MQRRHVTKPPAHAIAALHDIDQTGPAINAAVACL
jgi:hypothetical protein